MRDPRISVLSHSPVRLVAATAAALVVVGALHYVWRAPDRELARYLAEMKAAGKPTTMAEAAPAPVPDSENAAPLYLQAEASIAVGTCDGLQKQQWADPGFMRQLAAEIEASQPALELVRRAAAKRQCRFDVAYEQGLEANITHRGPLRRVLSLTSSAAVVAATDGDPAEAVCCLRLTYAVARHLRQDSLPLSLLTSSAGELYAQVAAGAIVRDGPLPPQEVRLLCRDLREDDLAGAVRDALATLAAGVLQFAEDMRHRPWFFANLPIDLGPEVSLPNWCPCRELAERGVACWYGYSPAFSRDELRLLRFWAEAQPIADLPWREAKARWSRALHGLRVSSLHQPMEGLLTAGPEQYMIRRDETLARRALLQAALALHEHRAQHGALPDALSDVHIDELPIPDDIFSGRPLVYRREGDGFVLYSIGANLKDDGGVNDGDNGDIVWAPRVPRAASNPSTAAPPTGGGSE